MTHVTRYSLYALAGVAAGVVGMALGAHLASANNGWGSAVYFSAIGIIGAPLAAISWATRRAQRRQFCAGVSLAAGILASMAILLELTGERSDIVQAASHAPLALTGWLVVWIAWISVALMRLIMFEPPRTRHRLSSRRGDGGA
jgi:hypothetical protein